MAASHPHVAGDIAGLNPGLLDALERLGAFLGKRIYVTSGHRSRQEQAALYANRASNPYPVAPPGSSNHETGDAADVTINGQPIQSAVSAETLERFGLDPLEGDEVHVDFAGATAAQDVKPIGGLGTYAEAAGEVAGAAGSAAAELAGEIVKLLWNALGTDGARILLYLGLVLGGTLLALAGLSRAMGLQPPAAPAGG